MQRIRNGRVTILLSQGGLTLREAHISSGEKSHWAGVRGKGPFLTPSAVSFPHSAFFNFEL